MSEIEKNFVDKSAFDAKIAEISKKPDSNSAWWNRDRVKSVVQHLKECEMGNFKKTSKHYKYFKLYEVVKIGNKEGIVLKRKSDKEPLIYKVALEDYYEKLEEAHKNTGHGGRDRVKYYCGTKNWIIPKPACAVFVKLCKICARKAVTPKSGVVIKPILSDGFNVRGQVDLIDFQSCPDGEFKFLMNYQDHGTKFLQLRPLTSKEAKNVAEELTKIFYIFGAPTILHSDNGREFVAAVIHELTSLWKECNIVHGRPRHPQSQGSVERANADIENMIRAWMLEKKSTNWSHGCHIVQVIH